MSINFAHRTFQWSNEARGQAAVHCVIIGFALHEGPDKWLFDYDDPKGEPQAAKVTKINGYLVEASNVYIESRTEPRDGFPRMTKGSQPTDWGNLFLDTKSRAELLAAEPKAKKYIRPFLGADEFLSSIPRWCLWLVDAESSELRTMPTVMARIHAVRLARKKSKTESVRVLADTPTLFTQIRQPTTDYLLVPRHSSENRTYIPMGFLSANTICGDANLMIPGATLFHFGVLSSRTHMAWVRTVCGRIKSDFRYSPAVYDSFPWPTPTDKQRQAIEVAAQAVIDARAKHTSTLADLYDPLAMPVDLSKAHQQLDKAVDAAYGKITFRTEAERVAFLFERYQSTDSPQDVPAAKKMPARKRVAKVVAS